MADGNGVGRRLDRLRQELLDEVDLSLTDEALEELAYCRFVEPHEGRRPTYGAVVWTTELKMEYAGTPPLPSASGFVDPNAKLDDLRPFADGRTSFVVRGPGVMQAIAIDPAWVGSELALSTYASEKDVTIVQRLAVRSSPSLFE